MIRFNRYPNGKSKCFTLSYDDGTLSDRRFIETVNRYGVRATFHLNSALMGRPDRIPAEEFSSLYKGHEISLHTATHPTLTRIPSILALQEIMQDRAALEAATGQIVRGMSYPYGAYNDTVITALQSAGVAYCRTTFPTQGFGWPDNFLVWNPTCHHNAEGTERARAFMKSPQIGALCYIWGHSYEFDRQNNWDLLETLCEIVTTDAGDEWYQKADTVWLATNIEIYTYITAVRNLVVSVDCKIIENPSAVSVWVEVDGQPVEIPGGKAVRL